MLLPPEPRTIAVSLPIYLGPSQDLATWSSPITPATHTTPPPLPHTRTEQLPPPPPPPPPNPYTNTPPSTLVSRQHFRLQNSQRIFLPTPKPRYLPATRTRQRCRLQRDHNHNLKLKVVPFYTAPSHWSVKRRALFARGFARVRVFRSRQRRAWAGGQSKARRLD